MTKSMDFEFRNSIRKHTSTIILVILLCSGAYYVLQQKKRENTEILRRFEMAKPTLPAHIYEDIAMLRWKVAQENLRARGLEKELIAVRKLIIQKEIEMLRSKVKRLEKREDEAITLPEIKRFLPHLNWYDPKVVTSRQKKNNYTLAFGIPIHSAVRLPLLIQTMEALLDHSKDDEKEKMILIVYINVPIGNNNKVVDILTSKYRKEISLGLLEIIMPPKNYYPKFFNGNFSTHFVNISEEAAIHNTKENLDLIYLMLYAQTSAMFYVHLADDIVVKPDYSRKIREFAVERYTSEDAWFELNFSADKCVGNLYRTSDIPKLSVFYLMHYSRKSCDSLVASFIGTLYCNIEVNNCPQLIKYHRVKYRPELFVKNSS